MTQLNPLTSHFRKPALHITVPSKGNWWNSNITIPENNEIPVLSMTGSDEILLKNADGLMNGDSTVKVIESCCPAIKNAWDMPMIDADTLLIAIRIASYGFQIDFETKCAKCNEPIEYSVDLRTVMQNIKFPDYSTPLVIDDLVIYLKPSSYKIVNLNNQELFQQQKTILALKDASISSADKEKIVHESFTKLTNITIEQMHEHIDYILLASGEKVIDQSFIKEFIKKADREIFTKINNAIKEKNKEYSLPKIPITCSECNHTDERDLIFDHSSFFGSSS